MDLEIEVIKDTIQADDCIIRRVGGSFFDLGNFAFVLSYPDATAGFIFSFNFTRRRIRWRAR